MQFRPAFGHELARALDQSVNPFVVVVRVVVKQGKLFDPGLQGERNRIVHRPNPNLSHEIRSSDRFVGELWG